MEAREGTSRRERALASALSRPRRALRGHKPEDSAPEPLPTAIRGLARATEALAAYLQTSGDPDETRHLALGAASEASTMLEEYENLASNLSVNALVDQIHSSGAPAWTEARRCEPWKTPPGARLERGYRLQQTQETDELE